MSNDDVGGLEQSRETVGCRGCGLSFVITSKALREHPDPFRWKCELCQAAANPAIGEMARRRVARVARIVEPPEPPLVGDSEGEWKPLPGNHGAVGIDCLTGPLPSRRELRPDRLDISKWAPAFKPPAAELNAVQDAAVAEVQRMQAEIDVMYVTLARVRAKRDELFDNLERFETTLDAQTRFLAGLNLQDHPVAVQKERARIVHAATVVPRPPGVEVDSEATPKHIRKILLDAVVPFPPPEGGAYLGADARFPAPSECLHGSFSRVGSYCFLCSGDK